MSKPNTIPIENRFSKTFDLQQQLNVIQQQDLAYSKYDKYASDGLGLDPENQPKRPLSNPITVNGQVIGGFKNNSKPKLCKKTEDRIKEDFKVCDFHPDDFHFRGKWKDHEIYVDTYDKKRAAKQIFFMFANQMEMKKFNYELINEKNGNRLTVKGNVNKDGKANLNIIEKNKKYKTKNIKQK